MKEKLNDEIIKLFNKNVKKITGDKTGFFAKLLDKDNNSVSTTNFFVVTTTIIGLILLFVPVFVLVIEAWYNHTVTTDLSGMAAYIGSVAAMFASVGITKAWTSYSDNKTKSAKYKAMSDTGSLEILNEEVHLNEEY